MFRVGVARDICRPALNAGLNVTPSASLSVQPPMQCIVFHWELSCLLLLFIASWQQGLPPVELMSQGTGIHLFVADTQRVPFYHRVVRPTSHMHALTSNTRVKCYVHTHPSLLRDSTRSIPNTLTTAPQIT